MSYSVNEAAKLVGKNPRKIKLDIRQGKLEASRLGDKPNSAYRIEYKDLRKTYSTSFEPQAIIFCFVSRVIVHFFYGSQGC